MRKNRPAPPGHALKGTRMNAPSPLSTGTESLSARLGVPAQRASDAYEAYASVHELGIALHRAGAAEGADLRPTA